MVTWRLLETETLEPELNMALDEAIASEVIRGNSSPTLRFYSWKCPSVTLGYFQKTSDIGLDYCLRNSVPVVRRPTGGRAILHGDELTYSFSAREEDHPFFKDLRDSYRVLSSVFLKAFGAFGTEASVRYRRRRTERSVHDAHCFTSVSFGEITIKGKKVIGSAQKRFRGGFLQQGSIPFTVNHEIFRNIFPAGTESPAGLSGAGVQIAVEDLKQSIRVCMEEVCGITLAEASLTEAELGLSYRLVEQKYSSRQWLELR